MSAGHIVAALVVLALMLASHLLGSALERRRNRQARTTPAVSNEEIFALLDGDPWMNDDERRFHSSNQFGR